MLSPSGRHWGAMPRNKKRTKPPPKVCAVRGRPMSEIHRALRALSSPRQESIVVSREHLRAHWACPHLGVDRARGVPPVSVSVDVLASPSFPLRRCRHHPMRFSR